MPTTSLSPALQEIFPEQPISYFQYIETALYHPEHGYYHKENTRVGRHVENDFFTSRSLQGQVFDRLLLNAASTIHPFDIKNSNWVEIGIEPYQLPIGGEKNPFPNILARPLPCSFEIPDSSVVFFNEILDAQPFHRFVYHQGAWEEVGVSRNGSSLSECILRPEDRSPEFSKWTDLLPPSNEEGYLIDLPTGSIQFMDTLLQSNWTGTLITFDYGKRTDELLHHTPQGTGRTYFHHQQANDLLARPCQEDITCHIWWDPLIDRLNRHGFEHVALHSQESFFMHHASDTLGEIISTNAGQFSEDKQTVHQLLHPANMGQKFQALVGVRT